MRSAYEEQSLIAETREAQRQARFKRFLETGEPKPPIGVKITMPTHDAIEVTCRPGQREEVIAFMYDNGLI